MLIGSTFAAFIIMNQPGIYQGIADRIVADIMTIEEPDLWVMASTSRSFDQPTYFTGIDIYRIRSIPGVLWANQVYRTWIPLYHTPTNKETPWMLIGVDPERLTGLPMRLQQGTRNSIYNSNALIIDGYALEQLETENKKTIQKGDRLLEKQNEFIVMGIAEPIRTYRLEPKAYILSSHIPNLTQRPSFILVKINHGYDVKKVALDIHQKMGYDALTQDEFTERSLAHFRKHTPIIFIFLCIATLGFLIGLILMWQIFSNFILTHMHQFGMLKMLGVPNATLRNMVLFQVFLIGGVGYMMGLILDILFGFSVHDTLIAFHLTWQIAALGALGIVVIIVLSSLFSILQVLRIDTIELCRDIN